MRAVGTIMEEVGAKSLSKYLLGSIAWYLEQVRLQGRNKNTVTILSCLKNSSIYLFLFLTSFSILSPKPFLLSSTYTGFIAAPGATKYVSSSEP